MTAHPVIRIRSRIPRYHPGDLFAYETFHTAAHPYCILRAYLLRLVRNAALDRYRSAHAEKRGSAQYSGSLDELAEIIPDGSDVVSDVERRELLNAVTAFLRELPQKQRDLFVRRYWYSTDIAALSEMFGMTGGNVKMTLSRLRKRLKKYLEKEGLL